MKAMTILLEEAKAKDGGRADDPFCCSVEKEPEQVGGCLCRLLVTVLVPEGLGLSLAPQKPFRPQ